MSRISIIYIGLALLVIGFIGMALFPNLHDGWHTVFSYFPGTGMVVIVAGILVRLFSPSQKSDTNVSAAGVGAQDPEKNFRYWRSSLSSGFIFWFVGLLPAFMTTDSPGSTATFVNLYLLALPIAITCLIVANKKRKSDVNRAVFILKLPFYYGAGVLVLIVGGSLLGLGL